MFKLKKLKETTSAKYGTLMWGCRMPVEIIIDNGNPRGKKEYKFETLID